MHLEVGMEAYPGTVRTQAAGTTERKQNLLEKSPQRQSIEMRSPALGLRLQAPFKKGKAPSSLATGSPPSSSDQLGSHSLLQATRIIWSPGHTIL